MAKKTDAPTLDRAITAMEELTDPERAEFLQRFFKTGPGEYAEGDVLRGIRVPDTRKVAKRFKRLSLKDTQKLLKSKFHEDRLLALLILVGHFERAEESDRKPIVDFYLANTRYVNNWDLVDSSAHKILGVWLLDKDREILTRLANSEMLWERRIAMVATLPMILSDDIQEAFRIADILLLDQHDLIQKAVGWMVREAGKRDEAAMEAFLKPRYAKMPRTALRYAIEKLPETRRQDYLKGRV